jgi:tRNA1(Val) A37 N6-methylase TrmN6
MQNPDARASEAKYKSAPRPAFHTIGTGVAYLARFASKQSSSAQIVPIECAIIAAQEAARVQAETQTFQRYSTHY